MKTSQLILIIAVLGMTSAAWTNNADICATKESSGSAEKSSNKTMADASCEMLAMMNAKMKGFAELDKSACDGAKASEIATSQKEIDDAISTKKCDLCTYYWKVLTEDSERGMGSGCKNKKKFGKSKGGESSASASTTEAAATGRFLQEASASGSVSGSMSGKGKSKCRRGMGKSGMGGMGAGDDMPEEKKEAMAEKKEEKKAEMTDEEIDAMEAKKNEMQKKQGPAMCAQVYMNMNSMAKVVGECKGTFASNAEFDAAAVDEYMSDMYDTHKEKWDALDCKTVTGQEFEAAATEAGLAAALAGFLGSSAYLFNFGMLIAIIMTFFRF